MIDGRLESRQDSWDLGAVRFRRPFYPIDMSTNAFVSDSTQVAEPNRAEVMAACPTAQSGARWFYWIAGLSVVNTILIHSGSDTSFIVGLGFTLVADYLLKAHMAIALVIDLIAIGVFAGFGFAALKGQSWAFIAGSVLYFLDTFIYLSSESWLAVGFHGFALFSIVRGYLAFRGELKEAIRVASTPAQPPLLVVEKTE